jgi:hypothetical protein
VNLPEPPPLFTVGVEVLLAFHRSWPDICDAWYASGFTAGLDIGRRQREAEIEQAQEAAWAPMAKFIKAMGGSRSVPYSALCEVRGEPERAERAREHERRVARGQDAPPLWQEHPAPRALPRGHVTRSVPSAAACLASWGTDRRRSSK